MAVNFLSLWSSYYHDNGMRDLFIELPYYTAEYMNLWMKSDNDEILNSLYEDWHGTDMHSWSWFAMQGTEAVA